jgi:Fic family protein
MDTLLFSLAQRIREEFEESPGLRMTVREASGFWGLDPANCERVFARLVATGFLVRDADERYGARGLQSGPASFY